MKLYRYQLLLFIILISTTSNCYNSSRSRSASGSHSIATSAINEDELNALNKVNDNFYKIAEELKTEQNKRDIIPSEFSKMPKDWIGHNCEYFGDDKSVEFVEKVINVKLCITDPSVIYISEFGSLGIKTINEEPALLNKLNGDILREGPGADPSLHDRCNGMRFKGEVNYDSRNNIWLNPAFSGFIINTIDKDMNSRGCVGNISISDSLIDGFDIRWQFVSNGFPYITILLFVNPPAYDYLFVNNLEIFSFSYKIGYYRLKLQEL